MDREQESIERSEKYCFRSPRRETKIVEFEKVRVEMGGELNLRQMRIVSIK